MDFIIEMRTVVKPNHVANCLCIMHFNLQITMKLQKPAKMHYVDILDL